MKSNRRYWNIPVVPGQKLHLTRNGQQVFGFLWNNKEFEAIKDANESDITGWPIWLIKRPDGIISKWSLNYFFERSQATRI